MEIKNKIIEEVSNYFNISTEILFSKSKRYGIVQPRQITQWLLREHTKLTLKQIAKETNVGDHTTVYNAIKNINNLIYIKDRLVVYCLIYTTNKLNLNFNFKNKEEFIYSEEKNIKDKIIQADNFKEVIVKEMGYKNYTHFKESSIKILSEVRKYEKNKRIIPKFLPSLNIKTISHINLYNTILAGMLSEKGYNYKEISIIIEKNISNVNHYVEQYSKGYISRYKKNLYINLLEKIKNKI